MAFTLFKFIQRLATPAPVNSPIAAGDRIDEALNKLQGQIDENIGGGQASTAFVDGGTFSTNLPTVNPQFKVDFGGFT